MIKTSALALLALRYLRSNRRATVGVALSQALVHARLWTKRLPRDWDRWKLRLPAFLILVRVALGPGMIVLSSFSPQGVLLVSCIGLALLSDVFDGLLAAGAGILTPKHFDAGTREQTHFSICACCW